MWVTVAILVKLWRKPSILPHVYLHGQLPPYSSSKRGIDLELMIFHFHFSRSEVPPPPLLDAASASTAAAATLKMLQETPRGRWLMRRDVSENSPPRLMSIRQKALESGSRSAHKLRVVGNLHLCLCSNWAFGSWQGDKSRSMMVVVVLLVMALSGQSLHDKINDLCVAYVRAKRVFENVSLAGRISSSPSPSLGDSRGFEW